MPVTGLVYALLFNLGQLLKERICSKRSKFFPLRVEARLERLYSAFFILQGSKQEVMEVVSFCKNGAKKKKTGDVSIHPGEGGGSAEKDCRICDGQGADSENSYDL